MSTVILVNGLMSCEAENRDLKIQPPQPPFVKRTQKGLAKQLVLQPISV